MLTRRQLIKTGTLGALALFAAGWLGTPAADSRAARPAGTGFVNGYDAAMLRALAPAMTGLEPGAGQPTLDEVVAGVDQAIRSLQPAVQGEVRQLFDLLHNRWGRRWLAGVRTPWAEVTPAEAAAFLSDWQNSRLQLLRSGYQALHGLICAAWYGNPKSWSRIGYRQPAFVMEALP
jgi:hypothetical protein